MIATTAPPRRRGSMLSATTLELFPANAPRARYRFADPVHRPEESYRRRSMPASSEVAPCFPMSLHRSSRSPSRDWIPSAHLAILEAEILGISHCRPVTSEVAG